jgi:hypothetical protein
VISPSARIATLLYEAHSSATAHRVAQPSLRAEWPPCLPLPAQIATLLYEAHSSATTEEDADAISFDIGPGHKFADLKVRPRGGG